ncbi:MAG: hypothetical protein H6Q71_30 [Firmicutes bacterium]|nr:hypothetical protein [Bacillota bacterium]
MPDYKSHWELKLNHSLGNKTRLLFASTNRRYLVDITLQSSITKQIIQHVLANTWNGDELIDYLNSKVANEATVAL